MFKTRFRRAAAGAVVLALAGCATVPTGPSMMVLPGTGKSFDQFRTDDQNCRAFALDSIGGQTAADNASQSAATSAVIGTALGAAIGAAVGGRSGAATGAGVGLGVGAIGGVGAADRSTRGTQRGYDIAYVQCMYANGHRVPISGQYSTDNLRSAPPAQAPAQTPAVSTPPPPPPGTPPAPPPGVR